MPFSTMQYHPDLAVVLKGIQISELIDQTGYTPPFKFRALGFLPIFKTACLVIVTYKDRSVKSSLRSSPINHGAFRSDVCSHLQANPAVDQFAFRYFQGGICSNHSLLETELEWHPAIMEAGRVGQGGFRFNIDIEWLNEQAGDHLDVRDYLVGSYKGANNFWGADTLEALEREVTGYIDELAMVSPKQLYLAVGIVAWGIDFICKEAMGGIR
jgi:hypothetical protein